MASFGKWNKIIYTSGVILFLVGIAMGVAWPYIYKLILQQLLQLQPSSETYKMWLNAPIPIYIDFYLFNWTNAEEFRLNKSITPEFEEIGPFTYEEVHERVNIVWNDNDTVSFNQSRTWRFLPERSLDISLNITNLNVLSVSMAYIPRSWNLPLYDAIINTLINNHEDLFMTASAGEWLFEGFQDDLVDLIGVLQNVTYINLPTGKFGWFYDRNGSETFDGRFTMKTGADDLHKTGVMERWNFVNYTNYYEGECALVEGNTGEVMPALDEPFNNLTVFSSDLCSSVTFQYEGPGEVEGVEGVVFTANELTFDNGTLDPKNYCYCGGNCSPLGLRNVSLCRFGSPAFVSLPHFYLADPILRDAVSGMKPNKTQHEFILKLQPDTGIPLEVKARFQVNLLMQPNPLYDMFKDVPKVYIPMLWFEERAQLDSDLGSLVNLLLLVPDIGMGVFYGIGGIGILMVLIRLIVHSKVRSRKRKLSL